MTFKLSRAQWQLVAGGGMLVSVALVVVALLRPAGKDWVITLRPVIWELVFQGQSPYLHPSFFSPPWALLPLLPFALLPPGWDTGALALTTFVVFGAAALRGGAKPLPLALLLTTPPLIVVAYNGQIDWFIPLGLLLPRPLGLFFLLAKPQLGLGLAAYWLVESWRAGGWRKVALDFGPVATAFVASFAIFGNYLAAGAHTLTQSAITWNVSWWPYSIPVGLALLLAALRHRKQGIALTSGMFFSPYVANYSLAVPLLGLIDDQLIMGVASASMWLVYLLSTTA